MRPHLPPTPLLVPLSLAPLLVSFQGPIDGGQDGARIASAQPAAEAAAQEGDETPFGKLLARFKEAEEAHARELRATKDRDERRKLRKDRVEADFWPEFEALAASGNGRALLWMARHVSRAGFGPKETKTRRGEIFRELVDRYGDRPWFGEAIGDLAKARRDLGVEWLHASLLHIAKANPDQEVQSKALGALAQDLLRRDGDEAAAGEILARLENDYPDTEAGRNAAKKRFEMEHLVVGKTAPDFAARTIDGYEFKLSDFRGKAVLLDFYGFW